MSKFQKYYLKFLARIKFANHSAPWTIISLMEVIKVKAIFMHNWELLSLWKVPQKRKMAFSNNKCSLSFQYFHRKLKDMCVCTISIVVVSVGVKHTNFAIERRKKETWHAKINRSFIIIDK